MLLLLFLAFSFEPTQHCFSTEENTFGLPNEICFKRGHWTKKNDGSSVLNLSGPEIQAMMEEVLPTSKEATVTAPFINRFEECGKSIQSDLYLENLDRKKDTDFTKIKVRVTLRYTEANCEAKWKTASIHYKLENN
jgi:hypothetical protein